MILGICGILLCCHPEPNMHKKCQSRVCSQPILPNHGFFSWTWLVTTWLEPQIIESKITFDVSWRLANHVSISLCRDLPICFWTFYLTCFCVASTIYCTCHCFSSPALFLVCFFLRALCHSSWCWAFLASWFWHLSKVNLKISRSWFLGMQKKRRPGRMQMLGLFKTCWFENELKEHVWFCRYDMFF